MNNITRKKFLVLVTTLPIIVVLGLVLHDMRISGRMNISTDFQKADAHVSLLTPQARLRDGAVIGEPLHFTLRTPTYFDEAVFDFDMRDVATPVSLGYEQEGGITFVPIAAPLLTNLNWNYGCGDDYCVYYKPTVQDITTVPISKVATYLLDKLKPYERSYWNTTSTYELPLLGSHAFVFEVNGDALDVEFDVVSGFVGADVIFNNEVITTYETNPVAIHLGGVTPGYYEVRLRAQADAQLGQLVTPHRFVIKDQIVFGQEGARLTMSPSTVKFVTYDKSGLGEVACDDTKSMISQTHAMQYCDVKKTFTSSQGMMTLAFDGVAALTPQLFFNPYLTSLTAVNEVPSDIEAIYTSYRHNEVKIALSHATKHHFLISAPYLETSQPFIIDAMTARLTKSRLYILDYFKLWISNSIQIFK